jgi:hypothetical protein
MLEELNGIVRSTECFRAAEAKGKLIRLPTGDGMSLLFFHRPEEPVRSALEISHSLKGHPHIQVRMGIHSARSTESRMSMTSRTSRAQESTWQSVSGLRRLATGVASRLLPLAYYVAPVVRSTIRQVRRTEEPQRHIPRVRKNFGVHGSFSAANSRKRGSFRS